MSLDLAITVAAVHEVAAAAEPNARKALTTREAGSRAALAACRDAIAASTVAFDGAVRAPARAAALELVRLEQAALLPPKPGRRSRTITSRACLALALALALARALALLPSSSASARAPLRLVLSATRVSPHPPAHPERRITPETTFPERRLSSCCPRCHIRYFLDRLLPAGAPPSAAGLASLTRVRRAPRRVRAPQGDADPARRRKAAAERAAAERAAAEQAARRRPARGQARGRGGAAERRPRRRAAEDGTLQRSVSASVFGEGNLHASFAAAAARDDDDDDDEDAGDGAEAAAAPRADDEAAAPAAGTGRAGRRARRRRRGRGRRRRRCGRRRDRRRRQPTGGRGRGRGRSRARRRARAMTLPVRLPEERELISRSAP